MTDEQFHTSDVDIKSGQTDVGGDVIGQDKVGGDKATVGDIGAGTVTAIGRGAKAIQQIFVRNSLPGVVVFSVVAIALSSVVIAIVVTSGYDLKGVFEVAQGYATPTSASASIAMLTPTPTSSTALLSPNVMSVQKMETLVSFIFSIAFSV